MTDVKEMTIEQQKSEYLCRFLFEQNAQSVERHKCLINVNYCRWSDL